MNKFTEVENAELDIKPELHPNGTQAQNNIIIIIIIIIIGSEI